MRFVYINHWSSYFDIMFYIARYFASLKIFFNWFTFSGNILIFLSQEELVFIFDWRALFFERIAGIWKTLLLLAKWVTSAPYSSLKTLSNFHVKLHQFYLPQVLPHKQSPEVGGLNYKHWNLDIFVKTRQIRKT